MKSEVIDAIKMLAKEKEISEEKLYNEIENGSFDYDFIKELPAGKYRLEGYIFPETYLFEKGIDK